MSGRIDTACFTSFHRHGSESSRALLGPTGQDLTSIQLPKLHASFPENQGIRLLAYDLSVFSILNQCSARQDMVQLGKQAEALKIVNAWFHPRFGAEVRVLHDDRVQDTK